MKSKDPVFLNSITNLNGFHKVAGIIGQLPMTSLAED